MTEGCEFRDLQSDFDALNVTILGCSFDQPAENKAFKSVNNYLYRLISDNSDRDLTKHYGAYSFPFFADRVTVVINPEGEWILTYKVSSVKQHPHDVLADMQAILGD